MNKHRNIQYMSGSQNKIVDKYHSINKQNYTVLIKKFLEHITYTGQKYK